MRRGWWLLLVLAVVVGGGCEREAEGPAGPPQLTVRQPLSGVAKSAELGEDCRLGGAAQCRTGHCVHAGLAPRDVFVCTVGCAGDADCPEDWRCLEEVAGVAWCAPPVARADWKLAATTVRAKVLRPAATPAPQGPALGVDGGAR